MSENIYDKFMEFYSFCYEHGGALKNHSQFGLMSNELLRLLKDQNALASHSPMFQRMVKVVKLGRWGMYERQQLLADIAELEKPK